MAIFVESPWPYLLFGIILEGILGVLLLQTGRGKLIWAMIGVGVLTFAGLTVERMIVTDREAVESTLDAAARAVETNDINKVLVFCSKSAKKDPCADIRTGYALVQVESVGIGNLEINVNKLTSPPSATATFNANGTYKDKTGQIPYNRYATQVTVKLNLEGDRWLVTECKIEATDPRKL